MRRSTDTILPLLAAATFLAFAAGCNRDGVKVYKVDPNENAATPPPPAPSAAPAGLPGALPNNVPAPDNSGLPRLKYTLPDGWAEKPATEFRVASFDVAGDGKTADVSVVPLGATSGTDAANVNRWRGQIGLGPVDESQLKESAQAVQIAGKPAEFYDLAGAGSGGSEAQRILGAILHTDDSTWYFKMMGETALVEKNKDAFLAFVRSVSFQPAAGEAPTGMGMTPLPASHPAIPGMAEAASPAGAKPAWTVPAGWKEGELMQFLVARYVIPGPGDASAAVNVSQLDGNGGGLGPNLNRWRNQLGQAPLSDDAVSQLPTLDVPGGKAVVTDFTGTDARTGKPSRLVGVVLPRNGQTWFYKLMGDPEVVGAQKEAFLAFVQSAQYP